ncbi:hypothetical protein DP939_35890 [Spongiactinospora rosea]|uniref:DNA-directed RNA polymerase specialized sigma24 family protein n=1 Tax=Spongiactinospora rosea TaxID=2248750 RepID=A0A366LPY5_9ACTN|nr:hypothetical protein [Spongiactinospora rosea]RBQ15469.1 hypothetical protein DP939_35890 [Spongiactinospora rosea]
MTHPLTDRRSRSELVAELYDRHAVGLFAYCHDQLGDDGAAAEALMSVMSGVPAVEPPRAALYALARREIYRRDVVYADARVDPVADPATALVERVVRELRPHQREVLLLAVVCGLTIDELAWVLDVAADTAADLAAAADQRFTQALGLALACVGEQVPRRLGEVYGALAVAPTRDVLARLPWRPPPALLRARILAALGEPPLASGPVSRLGALAPYKALWPTAPAWPVPLAPTDERTNAGLYEVEITPPAADRISPHEASTEPIPKLHSPPPALVPMLSAPVPADLEEAPPALREEAEEEPPGSLFVPPSRPERPERPERLERPAEPVYLMPLPAGADEEESAAESTDVFDVLDLEAPAPEEPAPPAPVTLAPPRPSRRRRAPARSAKTRDRHHDWVWEVIGLAVCIAIAMIVFFAVPTIVTW